MRILCFGDSNTYGYDPRSFFGSRYAPDARWVDILARKTGHTVINQGENGREIPCRPVFFPDDTDLLIVLLGTNDILQGRQPKTVAEHMVTFLSPLEIKKQNILLIAPPPLTRGEWVDSQALIDNSTALAAQYRTVAAKLGIRYADAGSWNISMAYDGVHFTEAGHRAFAEGLFKELQHD